MKFPLSFYKLVMAAAVALPTMALATITPEAPTLDNTDNCYMIGSAAELYGFAKMVNDGSGFNGCGKLTANIVVNENVLGTDNANVNASGAYTGDDSNFEKWAPINGFAGKFHGQGHTISGLYFNDPKKEKVGLFGNAGDVEIDGLGLVDSYFGGSSNVGGFVGYAGGTVYIRNSYNSSVVRGFSDGWLDDWWCGVGGFVGAAEVNKLEIENSYNLGFVTGGPAVGGLVGIIKVNENFSVSNSYNAGDVKGTAEAVGGLVGFVGYFFSDVVDAGIVSSYNTGSVCGGEEKEGVGGLVGNLDDGFEIRIVNSYNTGTVDGYNAGGLIAADNWGYADVYNSYNAGLVNGGNGDALGLSYDVDNFYYLEGSSVGFYTSKSAADFADGTVADALHGYNKKGVDGSVWGQGLGRDALPTLTGAIGPALTLHVYEGVEIDSAYTPDTDLPKPTREGYEFLGWYAKSDFSGSAVTRIPSDATGALEYFAKWEAQGGSGCIEIANADDLFSFAARVNGGDGEICGKLTADITVNENVLTTATGVSNVNAETGEYTGTEPERIWTPIGTKGSGTSGKPFKGKFYGNGHTISGLYVYLQEQNNSAYKGLFGYVEGNVVIDGVGIVDSYILGFNYVGGLVGGLGNGAVLTISKSYNAGFVGGNSGIGGLVGGLQMSLPVNNPTTVKINNSYNLGRVAGNTSSIGGLVGYADALAINNSYNMGLVSSKKGSGDDGLVGNYYPLLASTVANCFFTGKSQFEGNGATRKTAEEFANGTVAKALHDWCEKETGSDKCKEGGLDGTVWGQDVLNGDPLPNFSDKITGTLHDLVLHTFEGDSRVYPTKYLEETGFVLPTDLTREGYIFLGWSMKQVATSLADIVTSIAKDATGKKEFYAQWMTLNEDGCYEIASDVELYALASAVNNKTIKDGKICAKLTDDITVNKGLLDYVDDGVFDLDGYKDDHDNVGPRTWIPMNVWDAEMQITLDGNGKKISGLYIDGESSMDNVGLFSNVGAKVAIRNLGIVDSYIVSKQNAGAFAGYVTGSLDITNCYNASTIVVTYTAAGGLVGCSGTGTVNISQSYNAGSVINTGTATTAGEWPGYTAGGFVGSTERGTLNIVNSYNLGSVTASQWNVGGFVGYAGDGLSLTIANSYNMGTLKNSEWNTTNIVGYFATTSTMFAANNFFVGSGNDGGAMGMSVEKFMDGSVATYLHNYETTDVDGSVWGQAEDDDYPVFSKEVKKDVKTNDLVLHLYAGYVLAPSFYVEGAEYDLPANLVREGYIFLGWYKTSYFSGSVVTKIPATATGKLEYYAKWMKFSDNCYEIASAEDLYDFAAIVNGGAGEICGKLTDNISVNENVLTSNGVLNVDLEDDFAPWTPIGTSSAPFKGTFYGQGHTISGLYYSQVAMDYANAGLFGYVEGEVVIDGVGIVDSYISANNSVGALVGKVGGFSTDGTSLTISNSYNAGRVSGLNGSIGGLVGGVLSSVVINNSYNAGFVNGANKSQSTGGLVGSLSESATASINNSYNAGSVNGKAENPYDDLVCGAGEVAITNSFYIGESQFEGNGATKKTASEFANGTVAMLLHNWCEKDGDVCKADGLDGTVWGQNVGQASDNDATPTLSGVLKLGPLTIAKNATGMDSVAIDGASELEMKIPAEFNVPSVTFKRTFAGSGYSTIMLPFTPKFETDADTIEGVNFYAFSNYEKATISVTPVKQMDLEANTPYLVQAAGATELVFKNGGVFNTQTGDAYDKVTGVYKKSLANGWSIYGTYEYKTWEEGDEGLGKTYGFAGAADNDPAIVGQFAKIGVGAYIYPMRAYLEYVAPAPAGRPAANGAVRAGAANTVASLPETINVVIVEKGETGTEIAGSDDASGEQTTRVIGTINTRTGEFKFANDRWFDLNGRYLGNKKPTQKGAYYNNGKKVIVK